MCFAPQRRAIFPDRNFKNGSEAEVFCTFWIENVLRATAAWHFSGSQLQKWLRSWGVLYILTWKCASRHSGVPFSYLCSTATSAPAALATLLFEQQEPRISEKTQRFATSLTFRARVPSFCWLHSRVDLLSADLTALLLCFSTVHIVGS